MKQVIKIFIRIALFASVWSVTHAQDFSGGFKAGYNINYLEGSTIVDADGNEVESLKNGNGFHVGAILNYRLSEFYGLRSHVLFTQRGGSIQFDAEESYLILRNPAGDDPKREIATGRKQVSLNLSNSYIEIPLMVYGKYKNFELVVGPSLGLLISSTASGSIDFDGEWRREPIELRSVIDHQYYKDDAREGEDPILINTGLEQVQYPATHLAYFEHDEKDGPLYKVLNFGFNAEFNFFFNKGLFVGVGYYHGFNDVTNQEMDADWLDLDEDDALILRDDDDTLSSLRFSVGFRF
jgi:hypothetical protein